MLTATAAAPLNLILFLDGEIKLTFVCSMLLLTDLCQLGLFAIARVDCNGLSGFRVLTFDLPFS